jgi:hypothetical protein
MGAEDAANLPMIAEKAAGPADGLESAVSLSADAMDQVKRRTGRTVCPSSAVILKNSAEIFRSPQDLDLATTDMGRLGLTAGSGVVPTITGDGTNDKR